MEIECPCCERDWVRRVFVGATDREVFLCYECESVWFDLLSIDETTYLRLEEYLVRCGLPLSARTYRTFRDDPAFMVPAQAAGPGKGPKQLAR
ncbi:MAG: hypothetical protein AAFN59_05270 [Pseudomonadota bacterium]